MLIEGIVIAYAKGKFIHGGSMYGESCQQKHSVHSFFLSYPNFSSSKHCLDMALSTTYNTSTLLSVNVHKGTIFSPCLLLFPLFEDVRIKDNFSAETLVLSRTFVDAENNINSSSIDF